MATAAFPRSGWPSGSRRSVSVSTRLTKNDATDAMPRMSSPPADPLLEPFEIGLDHLLVPLQREDQRDVDVEAGGGGVGDRREAFAGRRDLDHHVGPAEPGEQLLRLGEGALGVVREIGVHLDRDEAVAAVPLVVVGPEDVGRVGDVALDERPVRRLRVERRTR